MRDVIASPSTRAHAGRHGIDLDALAAETGRTQLAREDVDAKIAADGNGADAARSEPGQSAAPSRRYWDVDHAEHGAVDEEPLSGPARAAAANLAAAHELVPSVTHHDRADMTALDAFREGLRDEADARGVRLTALAFHVKALARTLQTFPRFNASLSADGERLVLKRYVHVGIAVDTPQGLMVPVVRNADRKGLWAIAVEIANLATRARDRKVRPAEMGGASMTISNLGGIGGTAFTPIVNPPEVAILGLTRTEIAPVWDGAAFVPRPMLPLDLTYDHRVVNGADAARFLSHFAGVLAEPRRMLL